MQQTAKTAKVVIVGAGFSGLGLAIRLKRERMHDFLLLDRDDDVGGVWNANTYPGCTCDIPSHLYSFSFAPNPDWSHTYSPQPEIRSYLRRCADEFGIRPHLHTGVTLQKATWLDHEKLWVLQTSAGDFTANVLVTAMGPLTEPKLPDVPGLERFQGMLMHSARWEHDYELAGKRVASIGTGASAIQYVPRIAPQVRQLHVFQRTAPWVMPHAGRAIAGWERELFHRIPACQRLIRAGVYSSRELLVLGFAKQPRLMRLLERVARAHIDRQLDDPQLRRRVTPDYTIGCKRIIPSNDWYPALARPNVELVSSGLSGVREHTVLDDAGNEREVDAIILATGYQVTDIPAAHQVYGRDGVLLADAWRGSPRAYLGCAVPRFPNLFMLLGPNTGLGHGSMVYMIESQVAHIAGAIRALRRHERASIEVTPTAHAAYNRDLDERLRGTVWDRGGCSSFYIDSSGRNATLWPDWTFRFRRLARSCDPTAYTITPMTRAAPPPRSEAALVP